MLEEQQQALLHRASPFVQKRYRTEFLQEMIDFNPAGRHIVIDYWECEIDVLNDEQLLIRMLTEAAEAAGATVLSTHFHCFERQGVTAVAVLAESHLSIHTWAMVGYAGVDLYTCGDCDPMRAHERLAAGLEAGRVEFVELSRGRPEGPPMITSNSGGQQREIEEWFSEGTVPGKRFGNITHGFRIGEVIHRAKTSFQDCLIFESPVYGRVLVLDGIVQLSTADEHIYHEMLVHPPMFSHPRPQQVVIVGGGDGGTLREVLKHQPERVVMIDIDEEFVRAAETFLPTLSDGAFRDPRVELIFEDASEALKRFEHEFDVAIIDCNDAMGPSEILFEEDFYATVSTSLKAEGLCSVQAGSMLETDFLVTTRKRIESQLGRTAGFRFTMPSYHCGEYLFYVTSYEFDPSGPDLFTLNQRQTDRRVKTVYSSPQMHHASQVFPSGSPLRSI